MNQIKTISIKGFRRLRQLELALRPLNVLIGANGCGKTSLLDVFDLLSASAARGLNQKVVNLGGISAVLTQLELAKSSQLSFGLSLDTDAKTRLDYKLAIRQKLPTYEIVDEELRETHLNTNTEIMLFRKAGPGIEYFQNREGKSRNQNWPVSAQETALGWVSDPDRVPELFHDHLASCALYRPIDVAPKSQIRMPQQLRPASTPGVNGEDLVSCLYFLRESHHDRFESVEDSIRAAFPSFDRLELQPVAAGVIAMTWKDSQFSSPLYMNQLSEGTLRFLWLVTLLQTPGLPMITLLDEPEVSLHPELLSLLAGLLREASERTQLIVATQSDALVRFLQASEVLVMDLDEKGMAWARRADEFDIDEWLKDYTLEEVWRMGRIGGRA